MLLLVESRRIAAQALTREGERDGLEASVRCNERIKLKPLDPMLGKIDPGLAGAKLPLDGCAERGTPPAFMRSVSRRAFDLLAGVIDGKPLVYSTRDLDADHGTNVGAGELQCEGKARGSRFESSVERHPGFFGLGSSVLGDVDRQAAVLILLRLDL
jgi:hypothetical protein